MHTIPAHTLTPGMRVLIGHYWATLETVMRDGDMVWIRADGDKYHAPAETPVQVQAFNQDD